ncbi:MAG: hypothetical protein AAF138_00705 [Planctomycetota bacterium]
MDGHAPNFFGCAEASRGRSGVGSGGVPGSGFVAKSGLGRDASDITERGQPS